MHKDLLFVGDSVTYGMELEPNHKEFRFSHLVAKDQDLSYHNNSKSGACNDWIVKNATQYFREGHTCDTAIIQFSAPERWNFFDSGRGFANIGNATTTNNLRNKRMVWAHLAYYQRIYTPELANENYWKNVFFMDEYLKDKCKTIYLTLGNPTPQTYIGRVQNPTTGKLEEKTLNYDYLKDVEIGSIKQIVGMSRLVGHPSKEGHRKIADYVISKL
tara:strand:+ start:159 stop:806 length:648 start_codon:yes stop_codon:yes gene_type:complete